VASASPARAEPAATQPAANIEIPVAKADAAAPGGAPEMVALTVPLPTWRPQNQASTPQPEQAKAGEAIHALLAMRPADNGVDALAGQRIAVPAPRPEDVRTSPKADRVQPRLDPEATAVVVAAASPARPRETARATAGISTAAPVIAANFIRTAPEQIYLDGFQPRGQTADHRRFTGSAVKFLPIASFK